MGKVKKISVTEYSSESQLERRGRLMLSVAMEASKGAGMGKQDIHDRSLQTGGRSSVRCLLINDHQMGVHQSLCSYQHSPPCSFITSDSSKLANNISAVGRASGSTLRQFWNSAHTITGTSSGRSNCASWPVLSLWSVPMSSNSSRMP